MMNQRQRTIDGRRRRIGIGSSTAAAALAFFALAGCQQPVTGIFHHLAQQKPPIDRNLPNDLTIGGVARWDSRYVVAAGKAWARAVGTSEAIDTWTPLTSTYDGESANAMLLPLVRWRPAGGDPSLLAGALFVNDDSFALLRAAEVKDRSIAWSSVRDPAVRDSDGNGREVTGLFTPDADESVLFVAVAGDRGADRTYTLLSAVRRAAGAPEFTVELADLPDRVEAIAADGDGAYWAVAGTGLYTGALGGMAKSATPPALTGAERFRGVVHAPPNRLLVSGSAGTLWHSPDRGGTWSQPLTIAVEQAEVPLQGMAAVGATVLIGTRGFGYYTTVLDDGDLSVDRLPITTEAIYRSSISGFRVDRETAGNARTVFATTAGAGLWTTTVTPGELPDRWQLE